MRLHAPVILLLAALVLLAPLLLRVMAHDPLHPVAASYGDLHAPTAYGLFLRPFAALGHDVVLVSVLLGILSAVLFHLLMRRLARPEWTRTAATLLFIANPLFLALFTSLSPYTLAVPLLLAALLLRKRPWAAALLVLPVAAFAPVAAALLLILLLVLGQPWRELAGGAALLVLALLLAPARHLFPLATGLPVAEFGDLLGLPLLYVLLALLEGLLRWGERRHRGLFLLFLVLLLAAPLDRAPLLLAGLAAVPLAACFLRRLVRRRWAIPEARAITLLLIGCSFLFLLLTHAAGVVSEAPSSGLVRELGKVPSGGGTVLAPADLAPLIEAYTPRQPVLRAPTCVDTPTVCADVDALYRAWRLQDAAAILDRLGVDYLVITREMRDGLVWTNDDEGLLFLLAHSDKFALVASDGEHELWRYRR